MKKKLKMKAQTYLCKYFRITIDEEISIVGKYFGITREEEISIANSNNI